jgi:pilus assembly protein CpaE
MAGNEKIRVLIVDDIAETRENIRKLLQFEADVEVVGAARTGKEAIDLSQELKPDVVLMDINMPDMDGITATETIRRKITYAQVVILSVQNDPNYMRRAMLAGARDFIPKPPTGEELSAAIIVVYSPKGGSGVTTIATNLAVTLHNEETKVALIDGDLQYGDIAVFLNEQGKNTILDLAPRVDELDPEIIQDVMQTHAASGIKILAAPGRPEMADKVNGDQFTKVLEYLRGLYSYIVVDTSCYLTDIVLSVMDISDLIVLITTQEIPAIRDAKIFLSLVDGMRISRKRIIFVMNRYNKAISIAPEKVGESLKQEISAVIPLDERVVGNSVNRGVPFMIDNKSQPVGRSLLTLAELVRETLSKQEPVVVEKQVKK